MTDDISLANFRQFSVLKNEKDQRGDTHQVARGGDEQGPGGLPIGNLRPSFRQFKDNWQKFTRFTVASEMSSVTPRRSTVVAETVSEKIRLVL